MARFCGRLGRRMALIACVGVLAGCSVNAIPDFAAKPFEPFNREDAVAIALGEWRLFGSLVEDGTITAMPREKLERAPGLLERVGEYWWLGLGGRTRQAHWTGKHDETGHVFPPGDDETYAWSAAFISYIMRIAGAGNRFPYAPNHATYVNAAAAGRSPILKAQAPERYAPRPGDLLCHGREWAAGLRFSDLPTSYLWPGHCAIVVARRGGMLSIVGGNEDDAVMLSQVVTQADGSLQSVAPPTTAEPTRWPIVIEVLYDAETDAD